MQHLCIAVTETDITQFYGAALRHPGVSFGAGQRRGGHDVHGKGEIEVALVHPVNVALGALPGSNYKFLIADLGFAEHLNDFDAANVLHRRIVQGVGGGHSAGVIFLMERIDSDDLRTDYGEMLDGCKRDPENRVWYAPWKMELTDNQEYVGDLCFKGPVKNHSVEIGYGVLSGHENNGYASEALQAMIQWAFRQKEVVFVEAETAQDNKASQRVLEKCGFVPDGIGAEGPRFVLENPLTNWTPTYMLFGMAIGMSIGQMHDQMLWGMALGISLGSLVGILLNNSAKKSREAFWQQRNSH